jgi:hypothetical protein
MNRGIGVELVRFDLNLPKSTVNKIRKAAKERAIAPGTLARMLLVEKVEEELEDGDNRRA